MQTTKSIVVYALCVLVLATIAIAIEVATHGWLPGWLSLSLFIASPLIGDIVCSLIGKPNEVIGFLIFFTLAYGVPALLAYGIGRACMSLF